jgi:hypothetical protein
MSANDSVYSEKIVYAFLKTFFTPSLSKVSRKCVLSIFLNFFIRQYRSVMFPGRIPVAKVDHPLDEKIPFVPSWITIYLDFIGFWIRTITFFLRRYGRRVYKLIGEFIAHIGKLYAYAAEIYRENLSTTKRPFYIAHPRFILIHLLDPHLMCIPSLHVMVAIYTYKMFARIAKQLGEEEKLREQIDEMKQGALAICQAVLYTKQHSVNCIPAALYAMVCFCPDLFPPEEAEDFTSLLFSPAPSPDKAPPGSRVHPAFAPSPKLNETVQEEIKSHILALYRRFLAEGKTAKSWGEPLVNFLRTI